MCVCVLLLNDVMLQVLLRGEAETDLMTKVAEIHDFKVGVVSKNVVCTCVFS